MDTVAAIAAERRRLAGLRLAATDVDWAPGKGDPVEGPARRPARADRPGGRETVKRAPRPEPRRPFRCCVPD
ncbi:hypothetical protein Sya03_35570 [Spirilliplanes yamanashiensis]|uniref:Uncharacterized protein n=1 Tax=Spirilliplanes yamanashiensis TaxID=42233 RepID=A0A8J3YA08_9ACTN|nr:hypothetical protein Sya03_35570 [Spirilliplanes yamanashiensis]